jgi:rubrerythrin
MMEEMTTRMIKDFGSKEIDRQVWVCEECKQKCLTSYRSDAPKFCPNCGKKVKND